jgi:hypothetical protein
MLICAVMNSRYELRGHLTSDIQGVSGGIVNLLGGGIMDYSESISSYKHVSHSKYFRRWYYGLFRVNKFIYTRVP